MLTGGQGERTDHGGEPSLAWWLGWQARRTQEAVAVVAGERWCSYGALEAETSRLARHLRRLGVGPEVRVGVCAERSLELVVALLAVVKAGGAYMPLDPTYPPARLALLVGEALTGSAPIVLAQGPWGDLIEGLGVERVPLVVRVDADRALWAGESAEALAEPAGGDHLAYVIHTSGSTGTPKGVMNTHRGICNRLLWMQEAYGLTPADRVLQKTPFTFDVSVWEFFWPLLSGARLVLARPEGHRDPSYLIDLIEAEGITTVHFVPSMLAAFLDIEGVERCASLRRVVASGEALSGELRRRFFTRLNGAELHNLYGPTEAAVDVSSHACGVEETGASVPIGRPIANLELYVVEPGLAPAPVGVAGELWIGGVGVARGYQGRPELTAERFVPDPFGGAPGARVYRTGDLARWLPEGEIEFVGRIDGQVKVRGFRIEPGEIEAALVAHAEVSEAVVVARQEGGGELRLVAYVVGRGGEEAPAATELRRHLRERLPEHMVPSAFVVLESLPRTASGKVDRKTLPTLRWEGGERARVAPRTPTESLLLQVWSEVLGIEAGGLGVEESFFELGGDSILSLQVVARAARAGCRITPRQMFEHQTIAALAGVAVLGESAAGEQGPVAGPVPLTPIQRWFFAQGRPEPHHFNQAVLLEVRQGAGPAEVERALAVLVEHHDALRLRFAPAEGSGWRQWNAAPGEAPRVPVVDLSVSPGVLEEAAGRVQASLDLTRGPLLRAAWFELGSGERRLLLVIHHLAVDGVSWRVLLEDLEAVCRQLVRGEAPALPAKTTSFRSWAVRLAAYARTLKPEAELSWWLEQAKRPTVRLAVDYPGGSNLEGLERRMRVELDAEATRSLLRDAPAAYRARVDEVLLTALARTLTGPGEALWVDLEGHGREEVLEGVDLSRTVGWFTSLYPVLLEAGPEGSPGQALRAVRERLRSVPGRGLVYGLLSDLDAQGEWLAALPRPEVVFNYLGQLDVALPFGSLFAPAAEASGATVSPLGRQSHLLLVTALVAGGWLRVEWAYGGRHEEATVERLARTFLAHLEELIAHGRAVAAGLEPQIGGNSPSDFPLAGLSRPDLERLLAELPAGRGSLSALADPGGDPLPQPLRAPLGGLCPTTELYCGGSARHRRLRGGLAAGRGAASDPAHLIPLA